MVLPLPLSSPTISQPNRKYLEEKNEEKTTELAEKHNHYLNAVIELILSP